MERLPPDCKRRVMAFAGSLLVGSMVRSLVARVPVQWEQELGDSLVQELKTSMSFVENPKLKAKLLQAVTPLFFHSRDERFLGWSLGASGRCHRRRRQVEPVQRLGPHGGAGRSPFAAGRSISAAEAGGGAPGPTLLR